MHGSIYYLSNTISVFICSNSLYSHTSKWVQYIYHTHKDFLAEFRQACRESLGVRDCINVEGVTGGQEEDSFISREAGEAA